MNFMSRSEGYPHPLMAFDPDIQAKNSLFQPNPNPLPNPNHFLPNLGRNPYSTFDDIQATTRNGITYYRQIGSAVADHIEKQVIPSHFTYQSTQKTLICCECDFSFTRAIIDARGRSGSGLYSTTLHTHHEDWNNLLPQRLGDKKFKVYQSNYESIKSFQCFTGFGVDATKLDLIFTKHHWFDRILCTFPRIYNQKWSKEFYKQQNKELLYRILRSYKKMLSPKGEIHVLLFKEQFAHWKIKTSCDELEIELVYWCRLNQHELRKLFPRYTPRDIWGNHMRLRDGKGEDLIMYYCSFIKPLYMISDEQNTVNINTRNHIPTNSKNAGNVDTSGNRGEMKKKPTDIYLNSNINGQNASNNSNLSQIQKTMGGMETAPNGPNLNELFPMTMNQMNQQQIQMVLQPQMVLVPTLVLQPIGVLQQQSVQNVMPSMLPHHHSTNNAKSIATQPESRSGPPGLEKVAPPNPNPNSIIDAKGCLEMTQKALKELSEWHENEQDMMLKAIIKKASSQEPSNQHIDGSNPFSLPRDEANELKEFENEYRTLSSIVVHVQTRGHELDNSTLFLHLSAMKLQIQKLYGMKMEREKKRVTVNSAMVKNQDQDQEQEISTEVEGSMTELRTPPGLNVNALTDNFSNAKL